MYWTRAPFWIRLLALLTMIGAVFLIVAYALSRNRKSLLCAVNVSGGTEDARERELEKACGSAVKLNTVSDLHQVFFILGITLVGLLWVICCGIVLKRRFWDCGVNGDCDGDSDSEILRFYVAFGCLVLALLLPAFIWITSMKGRVCMNTPAQNCKSTLVNQAPQSLLLVGIISMTVLSAMFIIYIIFYGSA